MGGETTNSKQLLRKTLEPLTRKKQQIYRLYEGQGYVEVFCGIQFERIVGLLTRSLRRRRVLIRNLNRLTLHLR
eukprot:g7557.t1